MVFRFWVFVTFSILAFLAVLPRLNADKSGQYRF